MLFSVTLYVEDSFYVDSEELSIAQMDSEARDLVRIRRYDSDRVVIEPAPSVGRPRLLQPVNHFANLVNLGHVVARRAVRILNVGA